VINAVVGSRVAVQWDDGVYEGTVDSYHKRRRCFHICYDDGDSEWTEIPHKDVTVISSGTNSFAPQSISVVDRLQSRQLKETSEARTVPTAQQPTQREPMTRPGVWLSEETINRVLNEESPVAQQPIVTACPGVWLCEGTIDRVLNQT